MEDLKSIGVSPSQKEFLETLVDGLKAFDQNQQAAKVAMAMAIRAGTPVGDATATVTAWSTGGFDPDGSIRALIQALYGVQDTPYRQVEHLIQVGLEMLRTHVEHYGRLNLEILLADPTSA